MGEPKDAMACISNIALKVTNGRGYRLIAPLIANQSGQKIVPQITKNRVGISCGSALGPPGLFQWLPGIVQERPRSADSAPAEPPGASRERPRGARGAPRSVRESQKDHPGAPKGDPGRPKSVPSRSRTRKADFSKNLCFTKEKLWFCGSAGGKNRGEFGNLDAKSIK